MGKPKADKIMNDPDPDFSANHGWTPEELVSIDVTKSEALKKYLAVAQVDISSVEVPKITDAELDDIEQYIYFEAGNDYPEGNAKLVEVLKKIGKDAGVKRAPKLVPKCPPEIQEKLDHFGFKRHQVEIITDPSKIRKKRIYTEVEYCRKLGKPLWTSKDIDVIVAEDNDEGEEELTFHPNVESTRLENEEIFCNQHLLSMCK